MNEVIHRKKRRSISSWLGKVKHGLRRTRDKQLDKRKYTRFDCMIPVEIHVDTPGQVSIINAVAKNISSGGMLIKCAKVFIPPTSCHLSFHLPPWFYGAKKSGGEVMAFAHVRHADPVRQLFGACFDTRL